MFRRAGGRVARRADRARDGGLALSPRAVRRNAARPRSIAEALQIGRNAARHLRELATEVDAVKRSAGFTAALQALARLWRYSPFNQALIASQRPRASQVASAATWATLGRRVRSDAAPIVILAPAPGRTPPFVMVPVYDVAQTKGRPLARLDLTLQGTTPAAAQLEAAARRLGITVRTERLPANVLGQSAGGTITIAPHLPELERAATLAHELAHELLHGMHARGPEVTHAQLETEADATSYVVMRALGLPSKAPTYIAWQGGDGALVMRSMKRIQRAARRILVAFEAEGADRPAPDL